MKNVCSRLSNNDVYYTACLAAKQSKLSNQGNTLKHSEPMKRIKTHKNQRSPSEAVMMFIGYALLIQARSDTALPEELMVPLSFLAISHFVYKS